MNTMKLKQNLTLRRVGRNYMVVQLSDEGANLTNVYTMNETAAFLWKEFEKRDFTQDEMVKRLLDDYDVTEEKAAHDVDCLLKEWSKFGLIG